MKLKKALFNSNTTISNHTIITPLTLYKLGNKTQWWSELFKAWHDWVAELSSEANQAVLVHLTFQFCSDSLQKRHWHFPKKWPIVLWTGVSLAPGLHVNYWWISLVVTIPFSSFTEFRFKTFKGHYKQSSLLLHLSLHCFGVLHPSAPSVLALLQSSCPHLLSFCPLGLCAYILFHIILPFSDFSWQSRELPR